MNDTSVKRYHPVHYGDEEGTLTISSTELVFVSEERNETWPCRAIRRHMIKSTNDNKHLLRLIMILDNNNNNAEEKTVILRAATRRVVEDIKANVARVKPRRRASLSPTPSAAGSVSHDLPSHWTGSPPFASKLVAISPKRKEYWDVLKTLRETMDGPCHLSSLSRIQNEGLWSYYQFRKHQLAKKYATTNQSQEQQDSYLKERTVWHGTSSLDPAVIYEDEQDGFMMQYSQTGFWGRGIYFSERAGYSDHYAYKPNDDNEDRQLLLVQLLIGQSILLDREEEWQQAACQELVAPPENPNTNNNLKYDAVSGIVNDHNQSTKIHVVYENGRGYPAYLVTYYKGNRDPTKSPYRSHQDALQGKKTMDLQEEEPPGTNNDTIDPPPKEPKRKKSNPTKNKYIRSSTTSTSRTSSITSTSERDVEKNQMSSDDNQQQNQRINQDDKKSEKETRTPDTPQAASRPGAFSAIQRTNNNAAAPQSHNDNNSSDQNNTSDQFLVEAAVVDEENGEVVVAEQMPHIWTSSKGQSIIMGLVACVLMMIVLVVVILLVWMLPGQDKNEASSNKNKNKNKNNNNNTGAMMKGRGPSNILLGLFKNEQILRSTIQNLDDPDSPQSLAQEWLLADPNLDQMPPKKKARRFILATFFYATNGPNWINNTHWLDYNVDECDWYFHQNPCKPNKRSVARIKLAWNNLEGTIVPELGVLWGLEVISLVGGMRGRIPQALFGHNSNLTELVLKRTAIKGGIPSTIQRATSLTHLELMGNNRLDEELPTELGNLENLETLLLLNNSIPGSIPSQIGKLQKLAWMDLGNNRIEGPVPSQLGYLQGLEGLYLGSNQGLVGTLPADLAGMTGLQKADLSYTSLSGAIPWCSSQGVSTELEGTNLFYDDGSC